MTVRLADYRPPAFAVDVVTLEFWLDPARTVVRARVAYRRTGEDAPLVLDAEAMEIVAVVVDDVPVASDGWRFDGWTLTVDAVPDAFVLTTEVAIDPAANTLLSGLYVSNGAFFSQCEAEGFRRIAPFLDRPDVMARYDVTITAPRDCPVLLSNGNPAGAGENADGTHWARWVDPHPKPCYLFAIVAGDLCAVRDTFRTRSGRDVDLAIWVRAGDEARCGHAMASLKAAMAWDEETFGLEYDLDVFNIAAVSDFNMGAMENKGLNVFNTSYVLASPETATDSDYQGIETVVAHEYFHNWTGNRITCRDWFQLSLKEGLTVFRDQEFTADRGSRALKRIDDGRRLRARQFPEDAGPLAHPVRPGEYEKIDNFYTATVYEKGAEVIRMMRAVVGEAAFRRGMTLYVERHDNSAATIEDFVAAIGDAAGRDLTPFLDWYDQAGTPVVSVAEETEADGTYCLTVRQRTQPTRGQPEKKPLPIPVAFALLGPNGHPMHEETRVLAAAEERWRFPAAGVPSLLRGFSAPVRLEGVSREHLRFLAVHDDDPFVRWDSGQRYALELFVEAIGTGALPVDETMVAIAGAALDADDPAFAAELLSLPSEAAVAERMRDHGRDVDPDAIFAAREAARYAIGQILMPRLRETYARLTDQVPYAPDGPARERRALRNTCLRLIANPALAARQFAEAGNMTDTLAALAVLSRTEAPEYGSALAAFHDRWRDDPLVLDKWFAIQAGSPRTDTRDRVEALRRHAAFDLRNPNRVRALIGAFSGNHVRFHEASGRGYALVADAILEVDRLNPQLSARLVPAFGPWARYETVRRERMRAELDRIAATPGLSDNAREMATRALAG